MTALIEPRALNTRDECADATTRPAPCASGISDCTNCLFDQPWWLDATAPGAWSAATVERDGRTVARLPYAIVHRSGLKLLRNPPLTQTLGPALKLQGNKYATRLSEAHDLIDKLIEGLPKCDLFGENFAPEFANPIPFNAAGFRQVVRCTYRVDNLSDLDCIWQGFTESARRAIRKAEKLVAVRDDLGLDAFWQVIEKSWQRQNMPPPYPRELLERVVQAATGRSACQMLFAEDSAGAIHAAVLIVWDDRAAYYLVGGGDAELRSSGGHSLLMWRAIQAAARVTSKFDFVGSMHPPIERFFRSFGTTQTPYFHVSRMGRRMAALTSLKDLAEAISGRRFQWFC